MAKSQYWEWVPWGMRYPWYITYGIYTLVPYWVRAELEPFLCFTPEIGQFWAISKMAVNQLIFRISTADFSITHVYTYPMRDHSQFWDFQKFYFGRPLKPWISDFWKLDHGSTMIFQNHGYFWIPNTLSYLTMCEFFLGIEVCIITFGRNKNKILTWVAFIWKSRPS